MLNKLLNNYQKGFTLEQRFYKEQAVYKAEIKNIFHKSWLFAGHSSQLVKAGDYFLFEFDKESIILVKNKDGEIKGHMNVCRHRGSHICLEPKGNARVLTCPYHAWSYDLDGNLLHARLMNESFDKTENGLHSVHVELVGGLIFVSLAKVPLSIAKMRTDLADVFDTFGFDTMKLAAHKRYDVPANWKLAVENYQECYHCAPSHPEYAKVHALAVQPSTFDKHKESYLKHANPVIRQESSDHYFDLAIEGEEGYQYDRMPLLVGAKSGGINGEPVAPLLGKLSEYDGGSSEFMLGPVSYFLIYDDHMVGYRFTPTSLNECVADAFWFVREDAKEGVDYQLDKLIHMWDVTLQADEEIIVNNQKGVDSHFYQPGQLSEMEDFEQNFLNWYIKVMSESLSHVDSE